ncbi:FtsX-like permease family protein [Dokdonia sinensis]|uniref:FtsX-like permease family protein n=1 Tax=Dokdonia sinensis TaxID=2479847 RepID=A0A3M0G4I0_9FLAO|nr:FtsX-like permease family protein [Dokdonia sinensis]RMB57122.1 FtsX-like permease family protein [Dokdonia sinensis]
MISNYFKIAWRNLWKHKVFSAINIISLSIGLSAAFVIGMMVYYDFTFDTFHKDGDRIYRIVSDFESPDGLSYNPGVPIPLRLTAKTDLPGIEAAGYFYTWNANSVKSKSMDEEFKRPTFMVFAEADYFDIFTYKWLAGTKEGLFKNPNEVVLSQKRAQRYFPNQEPSDIIGKELVYNDSIRTVVKGVVANFDKRTDIVFEEFISLPTAIQTGQKDAVVDGQWGWTNSSSQVFVKLTPAARIELIERELEEISLKNRDKYAKEFNQKQYFKLQPLSDIHFNENYGIYDYNQEQANKETLVGLAIVALFLLLLGCVNFINLNTAQAAQRAKEIGIRKTLGGSKKQLIAQFLGETFILTLIATIVSIILAIWLLQVFSDFVPAQFDISLLLNPIVITAIIVLLVIVTILSGFYPSLVLSRFQPAKVLKGQEVSAGDKNNLRKFLTVFQFSIAQIFIIATLLVSKQIYFLMSQDMGFKTTAIAYIQTPWSDAGITKKQVLANAIKTIPGLKDVSLGGSPPASFSEHSGGMQLLDGDKDIRMEVELIYGDHRYLELYDIQLLAGRKPLNDTINEFVINQTGLEKFGFQNPHDIIGKTLKRDGEDIEIVGVMSDFNQRSLRSGVSPMVFSGDLQRSWRSMYKNVHLSLPASDTESWQKILASVEGKYLSIYPEAQFKVQFMDETIARFYAREQRISNLLNWSTGLSVVISCLGLFGLVIHTTERRTKEIGIRKVLGASLLQLNTLLCKDFLILVGIAFIIALPLAYLGIKSWLQDYAYKTEMSWWVFALSGIAMVVVALVIMSIRTISTAMKNPVESLKTE